MVDYTAILTQGLRKIATDHNYAALYVSETEGVASFSYFNKIVLKNRTIEEQNGRWDIPDGLLRPEEYYFGCYDTLHIVCSRIPGELRLIRGKVIHNPVPVYKIRCDKADVLHFYSTYHESSRKIPVPDEEGNYIVTPSGSFTKSCRT